jgi:hypothetical protein
MAWSWQTEQRRPAAPASSAATSNACLCSIVEYAVAFGGHSSVPGRFQQQLDLCIHVLTTYCCAVRMFTPASHPLPLPNAVL